MQRAGSLVYICVLCFALGFSGCRRGKEQVSLERTARRFEDKKWPGWVGINPAGTDWLAPAIGSGMFDLWKSRIIPERLYFRDSKGRQMLCTDREGKVLWRRAIRSHYPLLLWDWSYDARAYLTYGRRSVQLTWISTATGETTRRTTIQMERGWGYVFVIGPRDGDFACAWEKGVAPPSPVWPHRLTDFPVRFYCGGRLKRVWKPADIGVRICATIGRNAGGEYLVVSNKGKKFNLLTFDREGRLVQTKEIPGWVIPRMFAGDLLRGPRGCAWRVTGKRRNVLEITRGKPAPAGTIWLGHHLASGKRVAPDAEVLWSVKTSNEIRDVSHEVDGILFLITWPPSLKRVDAKARKILDQVPMRGVSCVMGPVDGVLYAGGAVKAGKARRYVLFKKRLPAVKPRSGDPSPSAPGSSPAPAARGPKGSG